ncbi:MAG TPA: threonine/serine dehydratase [Actinocrinis sp.]|uniref:threonine ammonia-lyase n=1 Tax=Actinocrinis sp. TaxID=1920516 RepID=UPI002D7197EB|nr:threonine/serine dehydratase [Actinocrinis sp.]HZU58705.1 threonine/serine dehydratase [Actinocrinis sp.]
MAELVRLDEVLAAAKRIAGIATRTPLLPCPWADADRPLWIKAESLQPIGAFKIRGAVNALAALDAAAREAGVIAVSSGNHAQAVAYAAARFGVDALIVIPHGSAQNKVAATQALGATVVRVPAAEREEAARRLAAETGRILIHPFDDPRVIAGQGTIGVEIAEQAQELGISVDTILTPVSGGGLVSGVAVAAKELMPGVSVFGVEPELAADAHESLRRGERTAWPVEDTWRTVADALRSSSVGELTWLHIRELVDGVVTVPEQAILDAVRTLAASARLVAEPGGAVAVAAYLARRDELPAGRTYVAVLSGGNIDRDAYSRILSSNDTSG